jgi:hypothetical protein
MTIALFSWFPFMRLPLFILVLTGLLAFGLEELIDMRPVLRSLGLGRFLGLRFGRRLHFATWFIVQELALVLLSALVVPRQNIVRRA